VRPNLNKLLPGNRYYTLTEWEELGIDLHSIKEK